MFKNAEGTVTRFIVFPEERHVGVYYREYYTQQEAKLVAAQMAEDAPEDGPYTVRQVTIRTGAELGVYGDEPDEYPAQE